MLAFYNIASECNKNLVDVAKLKKGNLKGSSDENSDIVVHINYTPYLALKKQKNSILVAD
ncbi:MAG: hypothetical protein CR996_01215 [Draconibacterium sp.]|nr:MAG: hypothetical protein CR996_01215 [Draconibacterium sp.]